MAQPGARHDEGLLGHPLVIYLHVLRSLYIVLMTATRIYAIPSDVHDYISINKHSISRLPSSVLALPFNNARSKLFDS